jgi:quercetin dioxygenase-like cupin family protein
MAIPHAQSGEVVSVQPLREGIADARTETLVKTDLLEVIRLVVPAGKEISPHEVPGEITLQCLEGVVELTIDADRLRLAAGELVYLKSAARHAVRAIEDASLLLTILLAPKS